MTLSHPDFPAPPSTLTDAPLALFGGTFDPVHLGHVRVAKDTAAALRLPEVRFIPSKRPVHRGGTAASAEARLAMLRLALAGEPGLAADDCELARASESYTHTTLQEFRERFPSRALVWLIGVDAFVHIQQWHRWRELFSLAHFVVLNRPGFPTAHVFSAAMQAVWQGRMSDDPSRLTRDTAGSIYLHTVAPQPASSTEVRALLAKNADSPALASLLSPQVLSFIRANRLYGATA